MEISDIIWQTMKDKLKASIDIVCREYESNPKYRVKKIYEGLQLKGFCVCHDEEDFTVLDECHYVGDDKYAALKMWKFMTKGKSRLRIICQKANVKMAEYYKKIGFKVVKETTIDFVFERVKSCQAQSVQ